MCNGYTPDTWNRSSTPTPQVYYSFDKIDKDTTCGYMSLVGGAGSIDGKVLYILILYSVQQAVLLIFGTITVIYDGLWISRRSQLEATLNRNHQQV